MKTLLFLGACLLGGSLIVPAQNIDLSGGVVFEGEPYLAIDQTNPQHMLVAWMGFVPSAHLSVKIKTSFNGGLTWSPASVIPHISPSYTSADVSIAFDHSGNVFVAYIDSRQSPDSGAVYIVKSTDGGLTWGAPHLVISGFADGSKYPLDRPWLTIDRSTVSDTLYVTTKPAPWISPPNRPYLVQSADYGLTWSPWQYIDSAGFLVGNAIQAPMAAPATDSSGLFHCIYPAYLPSESIYPRYILATRRNGNSFSYKVAATIIGAGPIDTLAKAGHRLICDPSNKNHMALFTVPNLHGDLDIFCSETLDGGTSWSAASRVNDDAVADGKMQDLAWGDFDEHGNIVAAWRDRRNAPGTGYQQASEIWGAIKWKDSLNFSQNFKISDVPAAYDSTYLAGNGNDFMSIAMAQDTLSAAWGDVRTGVLNIWFSRRAVLSGISTGTTRLVHEQMPDVNLYPNPANNQVTLQGPGITAFSLSDESGNLMLKQAVCNDKTLINIAALPPGNYIATIVTACGIASTRLTILR